MASFIPTAPNQLWVSDITYIELWVGEKEYVFCYLTILMDVLLSKSNYIRLHTGITLMECAALS